MFEGVRKLAGGTWVRARSDGTVVEERYWDVWDHTEPLVGRSEEEIAERILDELRTSVRLRKVGDVPVGVFLSGGIDSSTNTALFSEDETRPVNTFSIGYDRDYQTYHNELHYARQMARLAQTDHHEKVLSLKDLLEFLPRMVHHQDEPLGDPVCIPIFYLSRLARDEGVIVCQVGEGADELFWGYSGWKRLLRLQHADDLPVPDAFKRLGLAALRFLGKEEKPYFEWLRRGAAGQPIFWGGTDALYEPMKKRLLSPRLRSRFRDRTSWEVLAPLRRRFEEKAWEKSPLNWMSYLDLNLRLPELLLMRVDKMSMAASIECRVPFLDHKFVELSMSLPQSIKTKNGVLKYILKKAVRGLIPDELIDRKKQGFHVPVSEWLLDGLRDHARSEIGHLCRRTDLLDPRAVDDLFNRGPPMKIWYLLNFALWWKEYIA